MEKEKNVPTNLGKRKKPVLKLHAPSKYSLIECLEELKFGRTASDQILIDSFIAQIQPQICYKTNEPCKYNCSGLCKESV